MNRLFNTDSIMKDDSFIRIHYVRYADDFVVGIVGSYTIAKEILNKIETFVNERLKLKFNESKTCIVDFSDTDFKFLGFKIKAPMSKKGIKPLETINLKGKTITRRKKIRIRIEMDTDKVLEKLTNNGFIRKRVDHLRHEELLYRGRFRGNLINLDHPDILKCYNSVLRGLQNYYTFAENRVSVARIG